MLPHKEVAFRLKHYMLQYMAVEGKNLQPMNAAQVILIQLLGELGVWLLRFV